jgi:hypothetical protein
MVLTAMRARSLNVMASSGVTSNGNGIPASGVITNGIVAFVPCAWFFTFSKKYIFFIYTPRGHDFQNIRGAFLLQGILRGLSDFVKGVGGVYLNFVEISIVRAHPSVDVSRGVPTSKWDGGGVVGAQERGFKCLV